MGTIWQNAPAISLENGCYDGLTPASELGRHGNLGIGAFDQLDGEMVGVDGVFYQVTADSRARVPDGSSTLPFCMVTDFGGADGHGLPPGATDETLPGLLDGELRTRNYFFALRLDGAFASLRTRCLPRQRRPFPPLAKVAETQPEFNYQDVEGTMVGFRAPSYVGRVAPPGHHLHFVSADRSFGGHVISFAAADVQLRVERVERQEVGFPTTPDFAAKDLA